MRLRTYVEEHPELRKKMHGTTGDTMECAITILDAVDERGNEEATDYSTKERHEEHLIALLDGEHFTAAWTLAAKIVLSRAFPRWHLDEFGQAETLTSKEFIPSLELLRDVEATERELAAADGIPQQWKEGARLTPVFLTSAPGGIQPTGGPFIPREGICVTGLGDFTAYAGYYA